MVVPKVGKPQKQKKLLFPKLGTAKNVKFSCSQHWEQRKFLCKWEKMPIFW